LNRHLENNEKRAVKVVQNILAGIDGKVKPEQRQCFFEILESIPSCGSFEIIESLQSYILKETNEHAMQQIMDTFAKHVINIGKSDSNEGISFLINHVTSTKQIVQSGSFRALYNVVEANFDAGIGIDFVNLAEILVEFLIKAQNQSSVILDPKKESPGVDQILQAACMVLRLSEDYEKLLSDVFNPEFESSIIFNEKFYTKSTDLGHKCLANILPILLYKSNAERFDYSKIVFWMFTNFKPDSSLLLKKRIAVLVETKVSACLTLITSMRKGFGRALLEMGELELNIWKDKPARSSKTFAQKYYYAINCVLPKVNDSNREILSQILTDTMVLSSHSRITQFYGDDMWVSLCYRCGITPFVDQESLRKWLSFENQSDYTLGGLNPDFREFSHATISAIKLCCQIAPEITLPSVYQWFFISIENPKFQEVSPEDILIWRTPEGFAFHNPLEGQLTPRHKLSKEELWEREILDELRSKQSRWTKKDNEIYNSQLKKESQIRKKVEAYTEMAKLTVKCTLNCIDSVDIQWFEISGKFFMKLIYSLLSVIKRELIDKTCGALYGELSIDALVKIGLKVIPSDIDSDMVVFTLLRAMDLPSDLIPPRFKIEFKDLIHKTFEQLLNYQDLGVFSFILVFPLIEIVISRVGAVKRLGDKGFTDILISVADFLMLHAATSGKSTFYLPRKDMVRLLLLLLGPYPRLRTSVKAGLLALSANLAEFDIHEESSEDEIEELGNVVSEFLLALLNMESSVRAVSLGCLGHLTVLKEFREEFDVNLWVTMYDEDELISQEATALWKEWNGDGVLDTSLMEKVIALIVHPVSPVRASAGRALCPLLKNYESIDEVITNLFQLYEYYSAEQIPEYDAYGMLIPDSTNKPDRWESRSGIALALASCADAILSKHSVLLVFKFLVQSDALGDRNEKVRREMLNSGLKLLENSASLCLVEILDLFDQYLSKCVSKTAVSDNIRESIVILMGTLARYLEPTNPRIAETISRLIETLNTPSEVVQIAVSECLPALVKINRKEVHRYVQQLLDMLFTSSKYGQRRGAAYGLAGVVKGAGITSLKEHLIMAHLKEAIEDKRNIHRREGALLAFETLSFTLGRMFEPYVIQILPYLLASYGDSNREIRAATEDACRVIMSKLSAHCVKLLLPTLLDGLKERSFRSKIGAIEVMASMSALAPKQLGQSLPTIVPKICEALGDSHQKVQLAAREALEQFGKVIKNPEIQKLVPLLIAALVHPNAKTLPALSELLDTTFIHYIDAPSLALLVPIIHRGMKERSAEVKKKAAQIMGNMSSLTEPADLVPYLDLLLPELKEILVDPVPDARTTAAKAFGGMVQKFGEEKFPGLVDELLNKLRLGDSGVDRSGAAQGLSEVLFGIGVRRLEGLLPEIIRCANSVDPNTREGFTTLLVYLPHTFGSSFAPFIANVVPTMLEGLADEIETVRDAALHLGKVIVKSYSKSAVVLVLPELEKGLFHDNWRIRQNSVQLIGDLIYRIAGISQQVVADENDETEGFGTENHRLALKNSLGERYEIVLASLYIVRYDSSGLVRSTAIGIWKALVANTPRTLKQILPKLMNVLLSSLASGSFEKRAMSARTLGDLSKRLGDNITKLILPIFKNGLEENEEETREGVCIGLAEMMLSAGKTLEQEFLFECAALVRIALIDSSHSVRNSAASTFDILIQQMGAKAIDEIIPSLLTSLIDNSNPYALEALKEIMTIRGNSVFPVLIPTLLLKPITSTNAKALGALITVAGSALNKKLSIIIPSLMEQLEENPSMEDINSALESIMENVRGDGLAAVLELLSNYIVEGSIFLKTTSCSCMAQLFSGTVESLHDYIPGLLVLLVSNLRNENEKFVLGCWNALNALTDRIQKEELNKYVRHVKEGINMAISGQDKHAVIEGFNLPKGAGPVVNILIQGLICGGNDTKEMAAYSLGDVISRTDPLALKPFVTQITGTLIRVVGDRLPSAVKTAILSTLNILLEKVPLMLKPFLPQLQRSFVKALSEPDSSAIMRAKTAECLSQLIPLQPRLDPLVVELIQGIKSADIDLLDANCEALFGLLKGVSRYGKSLTGVSEANILRLLEEMLWESGENESKKRLSASKCLGAYCNMISVQESNDLIKLLGINVEIS
jgi:HEAT repeat protein